MKFTAVLLISLSCLAAAHGLCTFKAAGTGTVTATTTGTCSTSSDDLKLLLGVPNPTDAEVTAAAAISAACLAASFPDSKSPLTKAPCKNAPSTCTTVSYTLKAAGQSVTYSVCASKAEAPKLRAENTMTAECSAAMIATTWTDAKSAAAADVKLAAENSKCQSAYKGYHGGAPSVLAAQDLYSSNVSDKCDIGSSTKAECDTAETAAAKLVAPAKLVFAGVATTLPGLAVAAAFLVGMLML